MRGRPVKLMAGKLLQRFAPSNMSAAGRRWLVGAVVVFVAILGLALGLVLPGGPNTAKQLQAAGYTTASKTAQPVAESIVQSTGYRAAQMENQWVQLGWCVPLQQSLGLHKPLSKMMPNPPLLASPMPINQLTSSHPNLSSVNAIIPTPGPWVVTKQWCTYAENYPRPQGSKGVGLDPSASLGTTVPKTITAQQHDASFPRPLGRLSGEYTPVTLELSWQMTNGSQTVSGWLWLSTTLWFSVSKSSKISLSQWDAGGQYAWVYKAQYLPEPASGQPAVSTPSGVHRVA